MADAALPCQRPLGLTPPREWLLSKSWKLHSDSSVLTRHSTGALTVSAQATLMQPAQYCAVPSWA